MSGVRRPDLRDVEADLVDTEGETGRINDKASYYRALKTHLGLGDPSFDRTVAADASNPPHALPRDDNNDLKRGDAISRFVVLATLGAGGMGVVYSAYDADLDRKVAIKLLASTANNADASLRLLREAQAMAKINHPNVIKVHEVGKFGDQIYLAMEFADAGTLRAWLRENRDLREILDAFIAAGTGLAAAHAAGLVHRDFKPDNVLRSKSGAVQVMDFGLVSSSSAPQRAHTEPAPDDSPLSNTTPLSQELTRTGSIMGTPTYMAPEQFTGAITTARTDQFSFCVALYEALYGARPFAGANYVELSVNVLAGAVRSPPPGSNVAPWLRRVLLRGLEIEPDQRFESMPALLAALQYDPRRVRRRVFAAIGGAVVVGAVVAAFWMLGRDHASCASGDDRIAAVWTPTVHGDLQHAFSAAHRPKAKASFDRLAHLVDEWNDTWKQGYVGACRATHGGEQSAHVLDLRMQCLTQKLEAERVTLALLANGGSDAIDHALDAVAALPSVNSCADAAALTAAVAPPGTLATQGAVIAAREQLRAAEALRLIGRYRASLATARSALVAARATGYLPVIAAAQLAIGSAQGELADPEAAATLADAMKTAATAGDMASLLEAAAGRVYMLTRATHYDVAQELADLTDAMASRAQLSVAVKVRISSAVAYLLAKSGKPEQAVARYQQAIALAMREGAGPVAVAQVSNLLAITYQDEGHYEDARKTYEQALAIDTQLFGADHPDIANVLNNIGNVYRVEGKLDDAKQAYDRALAIRIAALGPDHPSVGTSYNSLGNYYGAIGDLPTAMQYYEKEIALIEKTAGPNSFELVASLSNLADLKRQKGDLVAARAGYSRARTIVEAIGPDRPEDANILNGLGVVAENEGKYDEALDLYSKAEQVIVKTYGPDHPDAVDELINLVNTYRHLHRYSDAEALATRAQAAVMKAYGEDAPHMGGLLVNWGNVETDLKHFAAAIELDKKALALFEAKLPKGHPYTAYALVGIGEALLGEKQYREALAYYERALAIETAAGADPDGIAEVQFDIALAAIANPTSKAHAIASAKSAREGYKRADNTDKVTEISAWLNKHR